MLVESMANLKCFAGTGWSRALQASMLRALPRLPPCRSARAFTSVYASWCPTQSATGPSVFSAEQRWAIGTTGSPCPSQEDGTLPGGCLGHPCMCALPCPLYIAPSCWRAQPTPLAKQPGYIFVVRDHQ
jgi:hypothetical protein